MDEKILIPLREAQLCTSCDWVSNSANEECPKCHAKGSLMSLARVLNRKPLEGEYGPN